MSDIFDRNMHDSTAMIEKLVRQTQAETQASVEAEYCYRLKWYRNLLDEFKRASGGVELHPSNVQDIGEAIKARESHRDIGYRHALLRARNSARAATARLEEVVKELGLREDYE